MASSAVLGVAFNWLGHFELARPVLFSTATIAIAVAFRWQLRHHLWFWGVVVITVLLHALVIAYQRWTTSWIPAAVLSGYASIDLYVILVVISIVRKFEGDELDSEPQDLTVKIRHRSSDQRS